jgi:sugar lactone lactonase YvrE
MSNNKDFKVKNSIKPTVYHEDLGTVTTSAEGYSLATAVYDSVSFSVASQEANPQGLFFKPDGTKMYIIGSSDDDVNEYTLATPWNVSTASYVQIFSVASQETSPTDVFFKPDGTKMYVVGATGQDVNEYNLSTAWDISTASYVQVFSVASQEATPQGLFFKPDGTKMYVTGSTSDNVNEYSLSTPWNISTASYVRNFSVSSQDATPLSLSFKPDGTKMYVLGRVGQDVNEYTLSTPWDISTASYVRVFSVASQETAPSGLFIKDDGTKMYVVGSTNDTVYQYSTVAYTQTLDLSTGSVFTLTPSSNVQVNISNPADSGTVSGATLLLTASGSSYTITYPTSVKWTGGTAPTSPAVGETDVLTFTTRDGGTTYNAALAIEGAA